MYIIKNDEIERIEINNDKKLLYVYYKVANNFVYAVNTTVNLPESKYYRKVYSFDNLQFIKDEYPRIERGYEKIIYED